MKNNKKILTIIMIIVLILVLAIAGVAYAYFCTDVFKTDKQKFFKYMSQNSEMLDSLKGEELEQYLEKKKTQAYENSGEFYAKIDEATAKEYIKNKKIYNELQDFKIVFDGKKDPQNSYQYDTVSLQYSNGEKMTFEYMKQDDYYGIKVDKILKKFLTIENKNLKDFAENLGIEDTSKIPDKIEIKDLKKYQLTDEEIKNINDKCYKILDENLQETMFREEKTESYSKYSLTATYEQLEDIYTKIYQAILNDETILSKIKEYSIEELDMTEQEVDEQISKLKTKLDEEASDLETLDTESNKSTSLVTISVYQTKGKITNTEIITEEGRASLNFTENKLILKIDESSEDGEATVYNPYATITLEKSLANDELTYNLNFSIESFASTVEFNMQCNYAGIQSLENVKENYTIQFKTNDEDIVYNFEYLYNNNVTFKDSIAREDLVSNSIKLNNYNREKLISTLERLIESIGDLNKSQMNAIGLEEDENPILYMTPIFSSVIRQNSVLEQAINAKSKNNMSATKEVINLEVTNLVAEYYEEKYINTSDMSRSVDEYVNSKLAMASKLSEINNELSSYSYIATYDENIGLICTSTENNTKLICKVENGNAIWNE